MAGRNPLAHRRRMRVGPKRGADRRRTAVMSNKEFASAAEAILGGNLLAGVILVVLERVNG